MPKHTIYVGDTLEVLRKMPSESVDCIVTSPPYWGLRDYGKETNTVWGGDENCEHEWGNELRASGRHKKGETNPGKEAWYKEKGGISPKAGRFCGKCGAWYGQLGLEPTLDMYIDHMLQITKELKRVLKKSGVMFWNHGDSYGGGGNPNDRKLAKGLKIPSIKDISVKSKCLALQNYRTIIRMIDEQGWILRNIIVWHKPNHMPSSVKDRFDNAYEPVFMLVKSKKYWFGLDAVRVPQKPESLAMVGKLRGRKEGYPGNWETFPKEQKPHPLGKNPGNVWKIPTQPFPEAHFATFPEKLVEPMIKAGCPQWICKKCGKARVRITKTKYIDAGGKCQNEKYDTNNKSGGLESGACRPQSMKYGRANKRVYTIGWTDCGCNAGWSSGVVLDPFAGSGTTNLVAEKLGRDSIGIELNPKYVEIIKKRFKPFVGQMHIDGSVTRLNVIESK